MHEKREFIHYGSSTFCADRFVQPRNASHCPGTKPLGGLWPSPVDSAYGWDCENLLVLNKNSIKIRVNK